MKTENYNIIQEGSKLVFYPKAEVAGLKMKAQERIENILDSGDLKSLFTDVDFPTCVSPYFSGQAILDEKYLKLDQVVPIKDYSEMIASKEAIEHANELSKKLIEIVKNASFERKLIAGNKSNRLNLSFKIDDEWIRLKGFTLDFCKNNGIDF